MNEKRVKIRILPLRGIGGIGGPGTEAWVTAEEAAKWIDEDYAEYARVTPAAAGSAIETEKDEKPPAMFPPAKKRK